MNAPLPADLPAGRLVKLAGRGSTYVREVAGRSDAPTLVLLHGWTVTTAMNWFAVLRPLARATGLSVVGMDQRGHGQGIKPRALFRLADCADDVIALADALGVERIIPVGYSMGGATAQLVAQRHRGRVAGAVFCSTAAFFGPEDGRSGVWDVVMPAVATGLTAIPPAARQALLDRFLAARLDDRDLAPWMREEIRTNDPAMIAQAGIALGRFDARPWLDELSMPTAVVRTTGDRTVSPRRQTVLADGLPDVEVFDVDADHRAAVTDSAAFVPKLVHAVSSVMTRVAAKSNA